MEARGEANLSLDVLRGKQASPPKKSLKAEPRPNKARQRCEKMGVFSCWGAHSIEGEALWVVERHHHTLEKGGWFPAHMQAGGECARGGSWTVFCVPKLF